jgi:hypothetical protein
VNATDPARLTTSDKLKVLALFGGVPAFFVAVIIYALYFHLPVADGPQERALVAAIRSRDVAAARAAIAAGASLTESLPVAEQKVEDSQIRGREYDSAAWVIVRGLDGAGWRSARDEERSRLVEIARAIFEAGGNPNASVSVGGRRAARGTRHLVVEAVENESPELIQVMIDAGLDMKGEGSGLALLNACSGDGSERRDAVALTLIRAGANVNFRERDTGSTPLRAAVYSRRVALIDALRRAGATESGEDPR